MIRCIGKDEHGFVSNFESKKQFYFQAYCTIESIPDLIDVIDDILEDGNLLFFEHLTHPLNLSEVLAMLYNARPRTISVVRVLGEKNV